MGDRRQSDRQSRRDVLKLGAASVPAAAAAAVGASSAAGAEEAVEPGAGETRMRRTAHVAKYFETARF